LTSVLVSRHNWRRRESSIHFQEHRVFVVGSHPRSQPLFRHFRFLDSGRKSPSRVRQGQPWRRPSCSSALPVPMICVGMSADRWPDCRDARRPTPLW
jgi:hypothetical protein